MSIRNHTEEELVFVQPHALRPRCELRSGDSPIGGLTLLNLFGTAARAESDDGSWIFRRSGFIRKRVTIRVLGQEEDVGHYVENAWRPGGTVHADSGRRFRVGGNFWLTTFEIASEDGTPLLRYTRVRGLFRRTGIVRVLPEAANLPELPWLVFLGWYIAIMENRDRAGRTG